MTLISIFLVLTLINHPKTKKVRELTHSQKTHLDTTSYSWYMGHSTRKKGDVRVVPITTNNQRPICTTTRSWNKRHHIQNTKHDWCCPDRFESRFSAMVNNPSRMLKTHFWNIGHPVWKTKDYPRCPDAYSSHFLTTTNKPSHISIRRPIFEKWEIW